ncbi:hypothetical protein BCF33_1816 [Hasllibacter halocynthiae]|uniref:GlsB/YeaQ/YmgE family stress response membrane protein n=1 Tax=Hasllibacter halocynthiae TaxID=595589 RepID=A0A2T0X1X8_9RHOB|nr:GlsB/YeaQ/YmgE family stress response membrane protein [Hasllibacter halocynthiae]PRY92952.1 hypothetical protein BCF33_1816 [Hasllibacter halocynthiae]
MEEFLGGLGIAAVVVLALVGAVVGYGLARAMGGNGFLGAVLGALAAVFAPFVLTLLGTTVLVGAGLLVVALVGALVAAVIVGAVTALLRR